MRDGDTKTSTTRAHTLSQKLELNKNKINNAGVIENTSVFFVTSKY